MVKTCTCGNRLFKCVGMKYTIGGERSNSEMLLQCTYCGSEAYVESNLRLEYDTEYRVEVEDGLIVDANSEFVTTQEEL